MRPWILGLLMMSATAEAGNGPWTVARRDQSLYVGLEAQQFRKLQKGFGGKGTIENLGEGVSSFGVQSALTYGVAEHFDFEVGVPWQRVQAKRRDTETCQMLGRNGCATTSSVGVISVRAKAQLVDEINGAPLSFALGSELRYGGLTADTRDRITNVGEGTNDVGLFASIGHSGGLGQGYWSAYLDTGYRKRLANTSQYPLANPDKNLKVPGDEVVGLADLFLAPHNFIAFGPSVDFLIRPHGLDFTELDMTDIDRFAALRVTTVRAGAKLIIRDERNTAFIVSVLRSVLVYNNPSDLLSINAGISVNGLLSRKE